MQSPLRQAVNSTLRLCSLLGILLLGTVGCGLNSDALTLLGGTLFRTYTGTSSDQGPSGSGPSGFFDSGSRTNVDPCSEPESRKFVSISMRNLSDDYIHYFLVLIALVNGEEYPEGAVCPDDIDIYTSFGYQLIDAEDEVAFGHYCIEGPALLYFHEGGQFRRGGGVGAAQLASAIAPAQGTSATFDNFFVSSGKLVPVPNLILFHNPGTGEGAALKISDSRAAPCDENVAESFDPNCEQDAFYYVDENDIIAGSTGIDFNDDGLSLDTQRIGAGRRVPSEIQGTGCECLGQQNAFQLLAPSTTSASNARCDEFLRGGLIEYVFVREDTSPPFPQLVWRVTDGSGAEVHNFDSRADVP